MEVIVTISVSPLLSAIPCIRLIQFRKKCGLICSCANSSSICFSLSSFSCQSHILSPSIFRRFLYAKQRRIYCHYTTDSAHRGSFFIPLYIVFYSPRITASISSIVRGMPADKFSHPSSVTRQLSSRRKPIPHSSW